MYFAVLGLSSSIWVFVVVHGWLWYMGLVPGICGIWFPHQGIEPTSPALQCGFITGPTEVPNLSLLNTNI